MDAQIVVSVIIPVYNAENTLSRMMDSVLRQTLRDIEVIAVDDGSVDKSGEILDQYARSDARVRVIHRENGGAARARNEAMKLARGAYLYFADADDWLDETMLHDMTSFARKHNLQLTICGFYIRTHVGEGREHFVERASDERVYEAQRAFREDAYRLFDLNLLYPPWNKLYQAAYIRENRCEFPETFWDDFPFNLGVLRDVERVGVLRAPLYHFTRARGDSETAQYREGMYQKREEEHGWMLDLYEYWNIRDEDSFEMIYRRYIERVIGCIENAVSAENTLKPREKLKAIREILSNGQVELALKHARPRSVYMKLMLIPLRMRSSFLCYLEGLTISRVKSKNSHLFAALKANR